MRSDLCAGSYTLRAIFSPLEAYIGPNRHSIEGWILGPSPFSQVVSECNGLASAPAKCGCGLRLARSRTWGKRNVVCPSFGSEILRTSR
jgi:hypothetical protein